MTSGSTTSKAKECLILNPLITSLTFSETNSRPNTLDAMTALSIVRSSLLRSVAACMTVPHWPSTVQERGHILCQRRTDGDRGEDTGPSRPPKRLSSKAPTTTGHRFEELLSFDGHLSSKPEVLVGVHPSVFSPRLRIWGPRADPPPRMRARKMCGLSRRIGLSCRKETLNTAQRRASQRQVEPKPHINCKDVQSYGLS